MKTIPLLPETDLARIALLARDEKRAALRKFRSGRPTHSWAPFRGALRGIFNTRKGLFDVPRCTASDVSAAIARACKSNPAWLASNLELGAVLFDHVEQSDLIAIEQGFAAVPIGFGASVKFWHDFFQVENDIPVVSFVDPRRGSGLTKLARRFVFSSMYHHVGTGDFSEATFRIFQFPTYEDEGVKRRVVRTFEFSLADVVELEDLNAGIQETYEIWFEILSQREKQERTKKRAGGGDGFGF